MRLALRSAVAAATLMVLSTGVSVAGALPGPGTNDNSRFFYTEEVVSTDLVVNVGEGGQKKLSAVDYRLGGTVEVSLECNGQSVAYFYSVVNVVTGLVPDEKGRVLGNLVLQGPGEPSPCSEATLLRVEYSDVTLMNLTTGHVYSLDPISQDYPT